MTKCKSCDNKAGIYLEGMCKTCAETEQITQLKTYLSSEKFFNKQKKFKTIDELKQFIDKELML